MSLFTSFNSSANDYSVRYAGSLNRARFACLLGDRYNMGHLIGHMGKNFHELLQILVNWDESPQTNTNKDLLLHLHRLLARILA